MRPAALLLLCLPTLTADEDRTRTENQFVRIIKVTDRPGNKSTLHRHAENRVMIYLDAGDITLTYEDGRKEEQHWKAGDIAWSPAGELHASENVSKAPVRIVEIELKRAAPSSPPPRNPKLDPVALDPAHNVLLFDNPQVRVFRSWREPGGAERMHEHTGKGRVAVLLTDLQADVKTPKGKTHEERAKAGDALWSTPVTHAAVNTGRERFEMVIVEVK